MVDTLSQEANEYDKSRFRLSNICSTQGCIAGTDSSNASIWNMKSCAAALL